MSDVKHTALPWTLDYGQVHSPDGEVVAKRGSDANIPPTERDANMRYIVTACNAYPGIIAALEQIANFKPYMTDKELTEASGGWAALLRNQARAALAQAQEYAQGAME